MKIMKTEKIYQEVFNTLIEIIPEEWNQTVLYFEHLNYSTEIYFYYYSSNTNEPIYWGDIKRLFQIDISYHKELINRLFYLFTELYNHFVSEGQEPWTSLTYIIDRKGKLNIDFSYEDIFEMSHDEIEAKTGDRCGVGNRRPDPTTGGSARSECKWGNLCSAIPSPSYRRP